MAIDPISLGILWDRLISIADESVSALIRTSFSNVVRESHDLTCVLFDAKGRSVAQGTDSSPAFIGTAPNTLRQMLGRFPAASLKPGDVLMTNDPWIGTGHLYDVNLVRPVFHQGRLVGYSMSITHLPDIGGRGWATDAAEIFEEGLWIPVCKIVEAGRLNEAWIDLIRHNVRVPEQVIGDIMANVSCTEVGARALSKFLDEYGIADLDALADTITEQSERALREALRAIPDGVYRSAMPIDGPKDTIQLACAVEIRGDEAFIDFAGSTPTVRAGINVPYCYTNAFSLYAIKCVTVPKIPNNSGFVRPVTVTAPPGCILNALPPAPTGGRHVVGHFIPPLIFAALEDFLPTRVQAGPGMNGAASFQGTHRDGRALSSVYLASGGYGALEGTDGAATTPSPSNMTSTPTEIWENLTSTLIEEKVLLTDSGGAGEARGGLGQRIVFRNTSGAPMNVSPFGAQTLYPARGFRGGKPGSLRQILVNGKPVPSQDRLTLADGDTMTKIEPGGGGFGSPQKRARAKVLDDVRNGYVSKAAAKSDYGVE